MKAKKHNKKALTWIAMALVVALLTAMPLMAKSEAEAEGPVASILSAAVEKGAISTGIRGGGNLQLENTEEVTLPSGVKITEFLVQNGDVVSEGDPLAAVDTVSVMTAIMEVRETLEYLQEEIQDVRDETVSSAVKATAGGRVKKIYAQPGDSVQEVMLREGCLALLSLDGLMAVQIQNDIPLATGDSVLVRFPDDTVVTGRVESSLDGVKTITVEDEGYDMGLEVYVSTEDGQAVGTGVLYVHNPWKATAFTGTISRVNAREEKKISAGGRLFTLTDTDFTAQMEYLANQHREYEEQLQSLFQMYESGFITAPGEGQVSGIEEDSEFLLSGEPVYWEPQLLTAEEEKPWKILLLSSTEELPGGESGEGSGGETPPTPPETGETAAYTGYAGRVDYIGSKDVILTMSQVGGPVTKKEDGSWDLSQVSLDPANMITANCVFSVDNAAAYYAGDIVVVIYDEAYQYTLVVARSAKPPETELPGTGGFPGMGNTGSLGGLGSLAGLMGGASGYGTGSAAAVSQEPELYNLEGNVIMTLTPQDTATLTITIDQKDIAKVSVGQPAEIKVEALRGVVLEGTVVQVGTAGSNNGGSSKFTVKLQLPYSENMLDGMSATAYIPLFTKPDILTLPVEALAEDGSRTVVYTALDPKTGELSQPITVEVGISDGIRAEILSGLSMGQSCYYSYYDTLELDTSAEAQKFTFG